MSIPTENHGVGGGESVNWVTIDFEASCLPRHGRSFPIEVAVSSPKGTTSWLIKPDPAWHDWDWTEEAFRLHGIGPDHLERHGLEPHRVMADLQQAIGSARVIADSAIDRQWFQTLSEAAGPVPLRTTRIDHVGDLFDEIGATHEQIMAAQQCADALCPARHRAGADALWLRTLIEVLLTVPAPALPARSPWRTDRRQRAMQDWHAAA
jgi:hypothetical protein